MKLLAKIAVSMATAVSIAAVILIAGIAVMTSGMCRNEFVAEYPSPDDNMTLVVFQRDCGATTGFSTQASLVPSRSGLPGGRGNIFIADTNHGAAPSGRGGGPELRVRWDDPKSLVLAHHRAVRVFMAKAARSGVSVQYERLP